MYAFCIYVLFLFLGKKDVDTALLGVLNKKGTHGQLEMKRQLLQLKKEREQLQKQMDSEAKFMEAMVSEASLGGVLEQFDGMEAGLKDVYDTVRVKHKRCVELLKKDFGYHPAFRRGVPNEFTGTYYTPIKDPRRSRT
eukprot:GEMP01090207.1.p1 GENE.GEMP01090207.1~~GEMP01090207.1.p1  ORF type:complete len:138 (+),score=27.80 GEMP01090207.1:74-487(+)